jgi:hypothetical protein
MADYAKPIRSLASTGVSWAVRPSARNVEQMLARLRQLQDVRPPSLSILEMRDVAPIPTAAQLPIDRYQTRHAPSDVQEGFANRRRTILRDVERGMLDGAHAWYHNEPVRQQFIMELGESEGQRQFDLFTAMVAGTSSAAPVRQNIRKASWYRQQALNGLLPDDIDSAAASKEWLAEHAPPKGYGSVARNNDALWTSRFLAGDQLWRAAEPGAAHKILSFRENLRGNLAPWTGDRHEGFRLGVPMEWSPREKAYAKGQLTPNEYVAAEKMMSDMALRAGLSPAEFQSARWMGGAEKTGVESGDPTFSHALEAAVKDQAVRIGATPDWVLRNFIRNGGLLAVPPLAAGLASGPLGDTEQ